MIHRDLAPPFDFVHYSPSENKENLVLITFLLCHHYILSTQDGYYVLTNTYSTLLSHKMATQWRNLWGGGAPAQGAPFPENLCFSGGFSTKIR